MRSNADIAGAVQRGMESKGVFVIAAYTDKNIKAEMAKTTDAERPSWLTADSGERVDSG